MSICNIKERFSKRILDSGEGKIQQKRKIGNVYKSPRISFNFSESIGETDVGITQYISDLPGFNGVIKQRFSDFNVHEIDMDGKTAVLNSYDLPDESYTPNELLSPLDDETDKLIVKLLDGDEEVKSVVVDVSVKSKDDRKSIHQYLKGKYGSRIISNTSDIADKKLITIMRAAECGKDNRRPDHIPKFLHFIMSKSNMDTTEALSLIGTKLRIKADMIGTAGTKDKRGNTSQWVSIKNAYASKVKEISKSLRKMWLGNFIYKDYSLALGSLKGNKFEIALRNVSASEEVINHSMKMLQEKGFINYFGLQRFGNSSEAPTHEIGKQLIKEEYKAAVEMILKPRFDPRNRDMEKAREIYLKTKDAALAYGALRSKDRFLEGKLLLGLMTNGANAYVNALEKVPRNVRLLYLHAYQSYLWNKIASRRILKHGLTVLPGDLVLCESNIEVAQNCDEGDAIENNLVEEKPCPVSHITLENINKYSIYDVMLPMPGTMTVYPDNEVREWYKECLAEDNLTLESFNSRVKQFSLSGNYRKLVTVPQNMSWSIVKYDNPEDDLILSDADILKGIVIHKRSEGKFQSVIISFELDRSTYATMALREVLRSDTSPSAQVQLNSICNDSTLVTESELIIERRQRGGSQEPTDVEPEKKQKLE